MKKMVFCSLVATAFLSGNAIAEGCNYSNHKMLVEHDESELISEDQMDPELLALLLKKQQEQSETVIEQVVTYN